MNVSKPNRSRSQARGQNALPNKQSGDAHTIPMDEPNEDPHRPHRVNRQDFQKTQNDMDMENSDSNRTSNSK